MTGSGRLLTDSSILYRCSQKYYDKVLSDFQLGSGQLPFLIFIYENEGITMNGLAQMGCYDKGTVTKGVQRLEEAGYVTSEVSPQDKRVRFLNNGKSQGDYCPYLFDSSELVGNHHTGNERAGGGAAGAASGAGCQ